MRALLSCSDKKGIVQFGRGLVDLGYELVSTGGTSDALKAAGLPVTSVADVTGVPEMLDGRVKTLHPLIHGGILARTDIPDHLHQLARHGITPIKVVAVNLYPFEQTVRVPDVSFETAIEQIDIGGPALVRAAAKNHTAVVITTDPTDYPMILDALRDATMTGATRRRLAAKAFGHVATYDSLVAEYLRAAAMEAEFPEELSIGLRHDRSLRYGENPHQRAAAYRAVHAVPDMPGILDAEQISGPELSFNNLLDADAAWTALRISTAPTAAIVKHMIPCGLASGPQIIHAFEAALAGDPVSAFGGIVALNRPVSAELATKLREVRFDIIIAPAFTADAAVRLRRRQSLRLLQLPPPTENIDPTGAPDLRQIYGGVLVQTPDIHVDDPADWKVVTNRAPTADEARDMHYAWRAVRYVKSNAIVLVKDEAVIGVGSGQPNRLESVAIATKRAGVRAQGSAMASDAFFPFADGLESAVAAGVTAVVQPGGSVRDAEVIAAANAAGLAMTFTGVRHFRH
ncbi:MAG: bifunctional phosphoribosylaminoimidazolecarboxamide formyltransferase/IMP cyclohydrolase [Chloroflexota bacterium]|nr:bifunctional phosphoribosylaminoimidazolecarboxamide formyltransferase/IMP cyclohydrolase [Chloroflexota bacterium]